MILTCPSCGTRYVVKDGAIPENGRTVRCAQCKHSWHQDPEPAGAAESEPVQQVPEHGSEEAQPLRATGHPLPEDRGTPLMDELGDSAHPGTAGDVDDPDAQPLPGPEGRPTAGDLAGAPAPELASAEVESSMPREAAEAPEPYPEDVVPAGDERDAPPLRPGIAEDDLYSPFAERGEEPVARTRSRLPLIILLTLLLVAAIAAAIFFLAPPEMKNRLGLANASGTTPLLLQIREESRRELASGNKLFEVSGVVINPTDEPQVVPPVNAQLRSLDQQVVYRWTIPPPAPRLAPGASASFNTSNLDIPASAQCVDLFFESEPPPQAPCRREDSAGA